MLHQILLLLDPVLSPFQKMYENVSNIDMAIYLDSSQCDNEKALQVTSEMYQVYSITIYLVCFLFDKQLNMFVNRQRKEKCKLLISPRIK